MVLTACATIPRPTQEEIASADYGAPISQIDAKRKAKEFFSRCLSDPYSAKFAWGNVERGWLREIKPADPAKNPDYFGGFVVGDVVFGYAFDVFVNAKRRGGNYTGYSQYRFIFYNGSLKTVYGEPLVETEYIGLYDIPVSYWVKEWRQIYPLQAVVPTDAIPTALLAPPLPSRTARHPVSPEEVKLYRTPPANYQLIALVGASAETGFTEQGAVDDAIAELKNEAAKYGANGILSKRPGEKEGRPSGTWVAKPNGDGFWIEDSAQKQKVWAYAIFVL
jgi:hypothetical protein